MAAATAVRAVWMLTAGVANTNHKASPPARHRLDLAHRTLIRASCPSSGRVADTPAVGRRDGAVGAAGAMVFQNAERASEVISEVSRAVVHSLSKPRDGVQTAGGGSEAGTVALLSQQVEQLTRELSKLARGSGREVTVIHSDGSRGSLGGRLIQLTVVAVGGGYCYMWWKGYSIHDFMYVTRASLQKNLNNVTEGLDTLKHKLLSLKSQLQQQLDSLSKQQNDSTQEIKGQISTEIQMVQTQIIDLGDQQSYANQGIFLLSKVVSEVVASSNTRAAKELEKFTRLQPALPQPGGLRSVALLTESNLEDSQQASGLVIRQSDMRDSRAQGFAGLASM